MDDYQTMLHKAARTGSLSAVRYCLEHGHNVHSKNGLGETPLLCADFTKPRVVRKLLQAGARVDARNPHQRQPLHLAVNAKELESVQLLLDAGADVDVRDSDGTTPLCAAVLQGSANIVDALLKRGATVNFSDIFHAGINQNDAALESLLRHASASIISQKTNSELLLLISQGVIDAELKNSWTRRILKNGVDLRRIVPQLFNTFPFLETLYSGTARQVAMMLERGFDVFCSDSSGNNYLHMVGHFLCEGARKVKLLLDRGVELNRRNLRGATPLMFAMFSKSAEVAKLIVEHGGDFAAKDAHGYGICCYLSRRESIEGWDSKEQVLKYIIPLMCEKERSRETEVRFAMKDGKLMAFYERCRAELDELRAHKFYEGLTLLDVLLKSVYQLTAYARNGELLEAFDATEKNKYPIYGSWLKDKIDAAIERRERLYPVANFLGQVFGFNDPAHVLNRKIMSYLSDYDLKEMSKGIARGEKRKFPAIS